MNSRELVHQLGGRWHGSSGVAQCPAHDDREPSLSVRDGDDGRLLTHCFSGCSPEAVWAALRDRGLAGGDAGPGTVRQVPRRRDNSDRGRSALDIWRATRPAQGSPVEDYLRSRGITRPIPHTIRYHPALKHPDIGQHLPALVAAVADAARKVTGIQRIFLTMDGRKAPLTRPKMALGTLRGGAVRLAPTTDRVWIVEGVEDGLALMQMMGEPAWAVLGTGGYKTVEMPDHIRQVILAPDGDDAGQDVIQEAAHRLAGQGREVRAAKLPPGRDWCDVLDDYEERAGILEFNFEGFRLDAEAHARREAING